MWVCVGYVSGGLRARGIFVQRHRIREILTTIDPVGRALRRRAAIQSRQYNVRAPNHMWHIDGNHNWSIGGLLYMIVQMAIAGQLYT